jgi:hypothetical protein
MANREEARLLEDLPLEEMSLRAERGQRGERIPSHTRSRGVQASFRVVREDEDKGGTPSPGTGIGEVGGYPQAVPERSEGPAVEVLRRPLRDPAQRDDLAVLESEESFRPAHRVPSM